MFDERRKFGQTLKKQVETTPAALIPKIVAFDQECTTPIFGGGFQ